MTAVFDREFLLYARTQNENEDKLGRDGAARWDGFRGRPDNTLRSR